MMKDKTLWLEANFGWPKNARTCAGSTIKGLCSAQSNEKVHSKIIQSPVCLSTRNDLWNETCEMKNSNFEKPYNRLNPSNSKMLKCQKRFQFSLILFGAERLVHRFNILYISNKNKDQWLGFPKGCLFGPLYFCTVRQLGDGSAQSWIEAVLV